ncbi:ABC transporter substrate-binding protein [Aliarcobacter butzleri]|uniref:Tgt2/MlaC family protein n=1 Tax=Aliarcobacter butzleri TaxID=28197 RepID=UPI00125FFA4F|nr:ABC transporter substrate-binding protein [Aliarcobacter butzleri]MCT7603340.1 ABC transporter substrate-binding protein [Aliarcobacter butzleri]MCT7647502.1 ABC transporter substrate-binding protein [Aliarcobacter butzleri]MCT7650243.1 ABC transporter substrate-binding protein [Aliarcobacter butzleri]MDK2063562.1 ABC transporter substrate-binding protein [Aliarcobacter butzleri]
MIKYNFSKILLLITLILSNAFALKEDEIQSEMTKKIDNVLEILQQKDKSNRQKGDDIIKIVDDVFDYELMAKIALGKEAWASITPEKQKEFSKVFEDKLKKSYIEKLELYNDQKVKIIGLKPYNNTRLQLETELLGKDGTYQINYNFYNKSKDSNEWLIYDVDLVGVSIIQTYRQQFAGILKEKTFDEMFEQFKNQ